MTLRHKTLYKYLQFLNIDWFKLAQWMKHTHLQTSRKIFLQSNKRLDMKLYVNPRSIFDKWHFPICQPNQICKWNSKRPLNHGALVTRCHVDMESWHYIYNSENVKLISTRRNFGEYRNHRESRMIPVFVCHHVELQGNLGA